MQEIAKSLPALFSGIRREFVIQDLGLSSTSIIIICIQKHNNHPGGKFLLAFEFSFSQREMPTPKTIY